MATRSGAALAVFAVAVSTSSGGWSAPEVVAPLSPAASADSPRVVVEGRGNATAAWTVRTASGSGGAEAQQRAGGRWGTPRPLPGPPLALAVNTRGDQALAWAEQSPDRPTRLAISYRPAGGRCQPRTVVSAKGDSVFYPAVALDGRGGVLAVWAVYLGSGAYRIEAAARAPRGSWGRRRIVSTSTRAPVLAVNQGGDAVVVWLQSCASVASAAPCAGGGPESAVVRVSTRSARGVWSPARTLYALGVDASAPQVAVNASGTTIVLWETFAQRQGASPARGLEFAIGSATGRFGRPRPLFTGFPDGPADLAVAPTGEAVAVWVSFDQIYAAARRPRGTFAAPTVIGSGFGPRVGLDARGNALAVWTRSSDLKLFLHAVRRAAGGMFDTGVDLAPAGMDCTRHRGCNPELDVAVGANGNAVAIWQLDASPAQPFGDSLIQAARYR